MSVTETDVLSRHGGLPFPPILRSHILNCSFHSWYPKYRTYVPKCRLLPLNSAFVAYLQADGIVLPPEEFSQHSNTEANEDSLFSSNDNGDSEDEDVDPSTEWPELHKTIASTIAELSGAVAPKLNWSAPKDATWISATNNMQCNSPNEIYLLLKSSNFITHDLEHAFDGCDDATTSDAEALTTKDIAFHLVLRKWIQINPSVEFRCFVRRRKLLGICQRDLNHYDFLEPMIDVLRELIQEFFDMRLKNTFPEENFAFDVYIPAPHKRVWLVDVNPWAPRTDPLLFSWLELLEMQDPPSRTGSNAGGEDFGVVRLSLHRSTSGPQRSEVEIQEQGDSHELDSEDDEDDVEDELWQPEFRLIRNSDPEAYNFNTPQYSAHKLPRDVVEASQGGPGQQRELLEQWQEVLARMEKEDVKYDGSDEESD